MAVRKKSRYSGTVTLLRFIAFVVSFVGTSLSGPFAGAWEDNRTLIFVIDSSENMSPHLSSIKGVILTCADQSREGDYLGIVACSDMAKLLLSKKIGGPRDQKSISMMLDAMVAGGPTADVAGGIVRAMEETATLKRKGDKNVKGIIVVSASEPAENGGGAEILEKALREVSKFVDDNEWYIQYCYLNGKRNGQVESFVFSVGGLSYDINALQSGDATETISELYKIVSVPEELSAVRVLDLKNTVLVKGAEGGDWAPLKAGDSVAAQMLLRVATESRAILALGDYGEMGLDPEADIALISMKNDPLKHRALFRFSLNTGSMWLHFGGKTGSTLQVDANGGGLLVTGEAAAVSRLTETGELQVNSFCDSLSVSVTGKDAEPINVALNQSTSLGGGQILAQSDPSEASMIEEWKSWSKALVGKVSLATLDFSIPEVVFPHRAIKLGPVRSGGSEAATFTIQIVGVADALKVKMVVDTSIDLPDGLSLSTGVVDGDRPDRKVLLVKVDGTQGFHATRRGKHEGLLKIMPAPDSATVFKTIPVQVTITTKGALAPPQILALGVLAALTAGGVAAGISFARRTRKAERPKPHRVIGRLIVVNDPTGGRVGTINLEEISTKSSRLSLVIGSNRTAEVRLKHASVSPDHCTLGANLAGGRLLTYIEPIGSAKLSVNGEAIRSSTCLNDGAKIEIGNFVYQFEDTQFYKKVDVVYKNGKQLAGILDVAGMDAEGFKISPTDAVSTSERARVKFSDIRSVTFNRRAVDIFTRKSRPGAKPDAMKRVELMFKKGSTISGYVQREYTEGRHRYIELLPLEVESSIDYIVVDYSSVVEKKFT
jgi:hypothetical protein